MATTPLGTPQGVPSSTDFLGSFKPPKSTSEAIERESELISQMAGATKAEGEAAAKAGVEKAKLQAPIVKKEAEAQTAALGEFKSAADKMQDLEFKPTQESLMSLTGIASLTAIIGLMLGKTGGFSGQSAIDSMTGMMKGYQQGKADIFKQEQATFEKNMQAQKANLDKLKNKLDIAMKTATTNRQAAESDIAVMLAEIDSDYLKAKYNKEGLQGLINSVAKLEEMFAKRDKLAQDAKLKTGIAGALPKDAKTRDNFKTKYLASKNIDEINELLEDPKVAALITPATRFTPDFIQNLRSRFPELGSKLARVQAIEFEIGGKALTKNEREVLEPLYGWKGVTVGALKTRLAEAKRGMDNSLAMDEASYPGFKPLREQYDQVYIKGGTPTTPTATGGQDVGQLRSQAKARIAAGASEEAVKARFKELTGEDL